MRALAKAAVVGVPLLAVLLLLRTCQREEGGRWQSRLASFDPELSVAVDRPDLVVLAPDPEAGRRAGESVVRFHDALVANHADLVGGGREQRIAVVLFSSLERLQAFHGRGTIVDVGDRVRPEGFTDPTTGAIFLPPGSGLEVLRHETVHLVMAQSFGPLVEFSPWVKEGLAQLFERYEPARDPAGPPPLGARQRGWLAAFLPDGRTDLERLLALQDYTRFTGAEAPRNYAEAHLWTAFLLERRPRPALADYLAEERRQPGGEGRRRAFLDRFGGDLPALEAEFEAWLRGP